MAGRRSKLTPDVHARIVSFIRAGAFDWIAAEAAGIHRATFYRWLEQGAKRSSGPERDFYDGVTEARAQARLSAEVQVRESNPLAWLRYGPGRDRPDAPGWTESHQVTGPESGPVQISFKIGGPIDGRT